VLDPSANAKTELGLLQHGKITPDQAAKPFYVEARRVAGLFREALAMRPTDDAIRLETLRAALTASQDSLVAALVPRLRRDEGFLSTSGLTRQARAEVARDVAKAYQREGDLANAIRYTRTAITLGLDLAAQEKQLRDEQSRDAENARRAPQIRDTIEQDHVVQPLLPRRAA
jgi:hypothetical protein